jgi:hypothetical protein
MLHTLSESPAIAISDDIRRRLVGRSPQEGLPETSHINDGIPTIKMAKPSKYPSNCFMTSSLV